MLHIKAGNYYVNKKTGDPYLVDKFATSVSNSLELHDVVVYASMYNTELFYTREIEEFRDKFREPDDE